MFLKSMTLPLALCVSLFSLSSCSDDSSSTNTPIDNPTGKTTVTARTISGKIKILKSNLQTENTMIDWTYGAAELTLRPSDVSYVAKCPVSASGDFTITLPAEMLNSEFTDFYTLLKLNCSPTDIKKAGPYLFRVSYKEAGVDREALVKVVTFKDKNYRLDEITKRYDVECFNNNATISGTASFSGMKYNLSAKKGWNIIQYTTDAAKVTLYETLAELPADVTFYI